MNRPQALDANNKFPYFNPKKFKSEKQYVCWIDIMGTKRIMSESFSRASNFVFKFHSIVIKATTGKKDVWCYPLMDGVFIVSTNLMTAKSILSRIFNSASRIFVNEDCHMHRFVIKGVIALGEIARGETITGEISQILAENKDYARQIMCGMPMIQAYSSERTAPPFGIYIHESARSVNGLQGKYYIWHSNNNYARTLKGLIISYFDWCAFYHKYLEMDISKIELYKHLALEYFSDMRKQGFRKQRLEAR